jgi:hypothetical protein
MVRFVGHFRTRAAALRSALVVLASSRRTSTIAALAAAASRTSRHVRLFDFIADNVRKGCLSNFVLKSCALARPDLKCSAEALHCQTSQSDRPVLRMDFADPAGRSFSSFCPKL